jgi:hypothetical protein
MMPIYLIYIPAWCYIFLSDQTKINIKKKVEELVEKCKTYIFGKTKKFDTFDCIQTNNLGNIKSE